MVHWEICGRQKILEEAIPLDFHYSFGAAILWFFVLQMVAVVASLGPARNAVRLTIREVLAYE